MDKLQALSLTLLLCLSLTACNPAAEDGPSPSTGSPTELPTETPYEGVDAPQDTYSYLAYCTHKQVKQGP